MLAHMVGRMNAVTIDGDARRLVGDKRSVVPAVPKLLDQRYELLGAVVAIRMHRVVVAAEIAGGQGVGRGDDVPAGPSAAQMVQRGKQPCQMERFPIGGR